MTSVRPSSRVTRLVTQTPHGSVVTVFATNYEPFGVTYAASGSDPSVKYTGQWDKALGLCHSHARFYDPTLGRFTSRDGLRSQLCRMSLYSDRAIPSDALWRREDPTAKGTRYGSSTSPHHW